MAANNGEKKILAKRFAHAISMHYRDFKHAYVYWIWLRGSASYVIISIIPQVFLCLAVIKFRRFSIWR